jgi:predicted enzyme related to lactoylglutathione lyase
MSNISYFEVPADDLKRARKFYTHVLGWDFAPTEVPGIPVEYWNITTGKSSKDTLNMGGLYQRREQSSRMIMYAVVDSLDHALAKVEEMGGKIISPKMSLHMVGELATIIDSEGNVIGLWEREKKIAKYPRSR